MNKKIIFAALLIIVILLSVKNSTYDVKKEYEKLNNDNKYIKVHISNDNPFKNIKNNELTKIIKETSVIFIGSSKNKASRVSINSLSKAAENTGIDKIYYIELKEIKDKKIIKKYKIENATLLTFKNGKMKDYINNNKNKITKKQLIKKYEEAINHIFICNPTGDTC